jgi:hypothetical protein
MIIIRIMYHNSGINECPHPLSPRSQDEVDANAATGSGESVGLSQIFKKDRMGKGVRA